MNLTIDWNSIFNTLTTAGLLYALRLFGSLTSTVKELQAEAKAERAMRQTQYEAVNQRIDDLRSNGAAVVRH